MINDNCPTCGKLRTNDWPECRLVEQDYPQVGEIKNLPAQRLITAGFQTVANTRCQFMFFLINCGFAKLQDDETYIIPKNIKMHPAAMVLLEQEIIALATIVRADDRATMKALNAKVQVFIKRAHRFFENQYFSLVPAEQSEIF